MTSNFFKFPNIKFTIIWKVRGFSKIIKPSGGLYKNHPCTIVDWKKGQQNCLM